MIIMAKFNLSSDIQPKFFEEIGLCDKKCPSYDGLLCVITMFKPCKICEPWVRHLLNNYKELTKYISDGTPLQSDDYTRGENAAWDQAIREFNKWLNEKEKHPGTYQEDVQDLYEKVRSLKYIQKLWGEGCEKLQKVIAKYSLGKVGDDIFNIVVKQIEQNQQH